MLPQPAHVLFWLARKPEGVGVWGQGKVAFSYTLWLPLPHEARRNEYGLLARPKDDCFERQGFVVSLRVFRV